MAISTTNHRQRSFVDELLLEQQKLTAVDRFSRWHEAEDQRGKGAYQELIPFTVPRPGEQYAFEVNLDKCSGCKACVTACHNLNGLDEDETWRSVGLLISKSEIRIPEPEAEPQLEARIPDFRGRDTIGIWNPDFGFQQHITTACHHCVDPGCLNGCPVLAYDKDTVTGIVKHLDDQCIGCQYCVLKCPYDVPKYSPGRGIVRKCDMCSGRLAVGEAPACVQSCPHEAIRITLVEQEALREVYRSDPAKSEIRNSRFEIKKAKPTPATQLIGGASRNVWRSITSALGRRDSRFESGAFLPGSPDPVWTLPATRYISKWPLAVDLEPADLGQLQPEDGHAPLVVMLVLTQFAVGGFLFAAISDVLLARYLVTISFTALLIGLASSVMHLGRPLKAWRAFLGVRRSWLSREIVIFGLLPPLAATLLAGVWMPGLLPGVAMRGMVWLAAMIGLAGVFCSGMIYHDTPKASWKGELSIGRFFATLLLLGSAAAWPVAILMRVHPTPYAAVLVLVSLVKLSREIAFLQYCPADAEASGLPIENALARSAFLMKFTLGHLWRPRLALGWAGGVCLPLVGLLATHAALALAVLGLMLCLAGELIERSLFFRTAASPRMPRGITA